MSPSPTSKVDLEAIRRRHSLSGLIGKRVKLQKTARGFKGLCPFHQEKTPSFEVRDGQGTYHCYGCGAHGDLFRWVMETENVDFREAIARLSEGEPIAAAAPIAQRDSRRREDASFVPSAEVARWLWRTSQPALGSIVERYLLSRGLQLGGIRQARMLLSLRFHPRAAVSPWRVGAMAGDVRRRAPAMLGLIVDRDGLPIGVHATYLRQDGSDKIERKMWGALQRGAVWLHGCPGDAVGTRIAVGEGIETVWSWVQRNDWDGSAAAALSLDNLQGGIVRKDGVWPLWNIRADLDRPPFLVERAEEVVVLVDADMKPLTDQKLQLRRAMRWERGTIDQAERARICATAAVQHWRHAGAGLVRAERPPMGMDFNDMVRAAQ
ncbi:DNA primase [Sphingomonas sp. S2M10]|uniref:CHC2 zinc finger domain-containing protein n=1 Tax=Sphingomonas sp. S2M10 TaxID=2705010 RepID=UPI00145639C7|nr:DNA primase [Sphingomonas sp. S2M10]